MNDSISFTSTYSQDNIFAKILRGELPNHTVLETSHCLAFMDVMPQRDGHVLVIPKTPAVTLLDLPAPALSELILCTQRVAKAVQSALDADGITLMQLNGTGAGQTVPHIHFHILPGSILGAKAHSTTKSSNEHLAALAKKISAEL